MNRLSMFALLSGTLIAGTQVMANDWKDQPLSAKRQTVSQVIDCMKKRMSSDRSISYNEAAKVCKQQVLAQGQASSPVALVADTTEKH